MSTERVEEIRQQWSRHDDRYIWVESQIGSLLAHIDALTTRLAESTHARAESERALKHIEELLERLVLAVERFSPTPPQEPE